MEPAKKNLLFVVDDEEEITDNYTLLLNDDFEIKAFNDPEKFVDHFKLNQNQIPDLVITDFKMPGLDGVQMVKKVQDLGFMFPVIVLSGFLDKAAVMSAIEVGVMKLLEKPTEHAILMSAIDQLMIEHDIYKVRKEIRDLTSQLREMYTGLRLLMQNYIPQEVMDRMIVEAPNGNVKRKMGFDEVLENLELRLEKLLNSEKVLSEMRSNKLKA